MTAGLLQIAFEELDARPKPRAVSNSENKRMIRARFDSQYTTNDNQRHWAHADSMSVDASASPEVRRILRMRNRYEYHNNSYYQGIADTVGNYVVGTGPRLQMLTSDKALNLLLETLVADWMREIALAETLKLSRVARIYNGESFSLLRNNPNLECPVKLDVFQIEADQVSSPIFGFEFSNYPDKFFDGVVLDRYGRPKRYDILKQHPGAFRPMGMGTDFDSWPAKYVLHDFKKIRPGQVRGIPEATPALDTFAELRRYAKAVLGAAETAADYAAVIESQALALDETAVDPMDTFNLERRMATVLPAGWKLGQLHAEQPTTTYDMFETAKLREVCRTLNLPLAFATLDARLANMSSMYVVTQPFTKSVQVDRMAYEYMLDRTLNEFLIEAQLIPGLLPDSLPREGFVHTWRWPRIGHHADPAKTATAAETRLRSGTSSIPREYAEEGLDWEEEQEADAKALGMSIEEYREALRESRFPPVPNAELQPVAEVEE